MTELGKIAYDAYAKNLKERVNRTVTAWEFLEDADRKAWNVAAAAVIEF